MDKKLQVGFGRRCITPPVGTPIVGYYHIRYSKGKLDDIFTTAIAFSDGENSALILSVEVCELSTEQCDGFREKISKASGVDKNAIFINCSHTHTGPQVGDVCALGTGSRCDEYELFLTECMVKAACDAVNDLSPATLSFATGEAKNISFCRRFRMKGGKVQTNPGVENPEIDHPLGNPDETVRLLKIERAGADDVFVVCFGTHADTVGGDYISGDWPGFVRSTLEGAVPGTKCLFLTGSQGDVGHINTFPTHSDRRGLDYNSFDGVPRGYAHTKHMGRVVAGAVLSVCDKTVDVAAGELKFAVKQMDIPANKENEREAEARALLELYNNGRADEIPEKEMELTTVVAEANRIVNLLDAPDTFPFVLTAITVGDLAFIGIPGELFSDIGRTIASRSSFPATFICCLTNGGDCYFPTSKAYDEGGYETRSSILKKGVEEIVIKSVGELLSELK